MRSYILLENIELYAYHGVFPQENAVGNVFKIDLKITVDISEAAETDNLNDTVNYGIIYNLVKEEMNIPSKLLEHAGGRIIKRLKTIFPKIEEVEIKLSKRNPPVGGQVDYASVILIG